MTSRWSCQRCASDCSIASAPLRSSPASQLRISLRAASSRRTNPKNEDGVDELGVAEVVPAELVARSRRIDACRSLARGLSGEGDFDDLAGEAALDELSPGRRPPIELRVLEGAALESRSFGADLAEIRAVETTEPEDAPRPGAKERLEPIAEPQPAEIAADEVRDRELELFELGLAEVDVGQRRSPEDDDRLAVAVGAVGARSAVLLGHCVRA